MGVIRGGARGNSDVRLSAGEFAREISVRFECVRSVSVLSKLITSAGSVVRVLINVFTKVGSVLIIKGAVTTCVNMLRMSITSVSALIKCVSGIGVSTSQVMRFIVFILDHLNLITMLI